jgi:Cof subfamily protein (haloacid dehalogenase superfamily)
MKKLLFFDIDGTLYDNKNDEVPKSTIEALKKLKENPDVEIAIATGRASYILRRLDNILPFFDAFVYQNGLHITYKGEEVFRHIPTKEDTKNLISTFKYHDLVHGGFNPSKEVISGTTKKIENDFTLMGLDIPLIQDLEHTDNLMQLYFFGNEKDFKNVQDAHPEVRVVPWHTNGADILPINFSKEVGIKRLAKQLGYEMKDVMAFGDAANDLEMIKAAGTGVVMGNGIPELKAIADYITDPVDQDGIYNALKHFNLI